MKKLKARKIFDNDLRPLLMKLGYSISRWARREGYHRRTVEYALKGDRNGPKSKEIRAKVLNLKY